MKNARHVIAFPAYVLGALVWTLAATFLIAADGISGDRHGDILLRLGRS